MSLPLFGSNVAPKDSGGTYSVIHMCNGLKTTTGWRHASAVAIATGNNEVQATYGATEGLCPMAVCVGWAVFEEPVSGEYEP